MEEEGVVEGVKNNAEEDENKKEKKKRKNRCYGNYKHYYDSRNGGKFNDDPRLQIFKKEWFEDKDCLDVGCNSGIVTISIAKKFCCRSILGIDIDPDRVKDAKSNLRKAVKSICGEKKMRLEGSELKMLKQTQVNGNGILKGYEASVDLRKSVESKSDEGMNGEEIGRRNLGDIVSFKEENFVEAEYDPRQEHYDTIVCLSVTQWIHLNWGDDGLMTLFRKIRDLLRPGGLFVLEPQKWKSYRRKRRISETTILNYKNIKLRPEKFMRTLLEKVCIKFVTSISISLQILLTPDI
ncbi:putative RNA methyltransferase bin3, bin3-type S-adenosyl-L-methionine binding protein [Lupinus albus]|uniref:RNA methyltransferase n=1 Tax=Lupinus albus TaxID=3870 RepID=A0A6A4PFR4_LUPAL|nr:putative RNA methyltransferase bin3, bin3-type S-adenosyl-L-methionine binding protein [Lupinus albus]